MRPIGRPFANVKMIDERRRTARASGRFGLSTHFLERRQFSASNVIIDRGGKNVWIISGSRCENGPRVSRSQIYRLVVAKGRLSVDAIYKRTFI